MITFKLCSVTYDTLRELAHTRSIYEKRRFRIMKLSFRFCSKVYSGLSRNCDYEGTKDQYIVTMSVWS